MLYFINKCAESWGWQQSEKAGCLRLEAIIHTKVPTSTRTQKGVKQWIEANYKNI